MSEVAALPCLSSWVWGMVLVMIFFGLIRGVLVGYFFLLSSLVFAADAGTPDLDALKITGGGFIDAYYGEDFNNPPLIDRVYGNGIYYTTFARNNEFNVNLAMIEAKLSDARDDVRGRLALQAGTSVQAMTITEPAVGTLSGPTVSRFIQEATIGYKLAERLWLDAGIYPSHLGGESFVSRDNWIYVRSMVDEFSPNYQSGVRLSYSFNEEWSGQLHLLNGWQNVSETNSNKALGTQLVYSPTTHLSFSDNTYFGQETPIGTSYYLNRYLNDFIVTWSLTNSPVSFQATYDIGFQQRTDYSAYNTFGGGSLITKYDVNEKSSLAFRAERYADPQQVIVPVVSGAQTSNGFSAWAASITYNRQLKKYLLWRAEIRDLWSADSIFISGNSFSNSDLFCVTSLGLSF